MADHEDYLPGEAPAAHHGSHEDGGSDKVSIAGLLGVPAELTAHAALPTVHQDAPALILTHKGDASAHHAKYTDAEARLVHNPISIPPAAFLSYIDTQDWFISTYFIRNNIVLTAQYFEAPIFFPDGVTVTKLTLFGFRNKAAATLSLQLRRQDRAGALGIMATVTAGWTGGYDSGFTTTIAFSVIDNNNYTYHVELTLDPDINVNDVRLSGVLITFS